MVIRYCWPKAATLPEALRNMNTNDFCFPDSRNTKKKQLPQMDRNRKYPWLNTEAWFQPSLEVGRNSDPLSYLIPHPSPTRHPFTEKEPETPRTERGLDKDSSVLSPLSAPFPPQKYGHWRRGEDWRYTPRKGRKWQNCSGTRNSGARMTQCVPDGNVGLGEHLER